MSKKKLLPAIDFNSPVILSLFFISLLLLILNNFLPRNTIHSLFACYFTGWLDPFLYPRLFTHVLAHQNLAHFTGNYLLMLAIGPLLEEKYGSGSLIRMMVITAGITGLIHIVFFRNVALVGASGLVFMTILLASFTNIREGRLPMTVLLVGFLYIGNEVIRGLLSTDNISQLSHIIGGICGAGFGFEYQGIQYRRKRH